MILNGYCIITTEFYHVTNDIEPKQHIVCDI